MLSDRVLGLGILPEIANCLDWFFTTTQQSLGLNHLQGISCCTGLRGPSGSLLLLSRGQLEGWSRVFMASAVAGADLAQRLLGSPERWGLKTERAPRLSAHSSSPRLRKPTCLFKLGRIP